MFNRLFFFLDLTIEFDFIIKIILIVYFNILMKIYFHYIIFTYSYN